MDGESTTLRFPFRHSAAKVFMGATPSGRGASSDFAGSSPSSPRAVTLPPHSHAARGSRGPPAERRTGVALIDGMTAEQAYLHAARSGDVVGLVAFAASGGDLDVWDSVGRTATILAARHRHPRALQWCLRHKVPAFVGVRRGPGGPAALLEACFWEKLTTRPGLTNDQVMDDPELVLAIVDDGVELTCAVDGSRVKVPVDVNRRDDTGYHALHHAAANNFVRIVDALLRCPRVLGECTNMYGATPEVVARRTGHASLADFIGHKVLENARWSGLRATWVTLCVRLDLT